MKTKFTYFMFAIAMALVVGSPQSNATPPQETATCFRAHNYDDGTLCLSASPKFVGPQMPIEVSIDHSSQEATYTYYALGPIKQHRCVHTKEGPHCFDFPVLLFRRTVAGGFEDIELDLPNLNRGEARIGGLSYDLYEEPLA